ncbi:VC0807 family protein [Rheinheimera sp. WS51]|uniref:VC0807 family protein n=1 Tax=Rheinheimera sp. WS51 TaxID=3425886 RepID=UPI003D947EC0
MNQPRSKKKSNFLSDMLFNIIAPALILSKLSTEDTLGPVWSVVIALAFPLAYGGWSLIKSGKVNFFSILGVISVLLTGGISLLQLDPAYIAIKEAMVPALIGVAVLISQYTRYPLVKTLLINPEVIDIEKLDKALALRGNSAKFAKSTERAGFIVAGTFFISAALNYILAKAIVVSLPGTTAYAEELGRMTWLSYPVIALPSMVMLMAAIFYIFRQIGRLTGQSLEEFIVL